MCLIAWRETAVGILCAIGVLLLVPCCTGVRVILPNHSVCFPFQSFHIHNSISPSSSPPIFSCPSSRRPSISSMAVYFSCIRCVLPPLISLLFFLYPSSSSVLPISFCFSIILLLGAIAFRRLFSGHSSFFCLPSLFLLFF